MKKSSELQQQSHPSLLTHPLFLIRQSNFVIGAELVVLENVFSTQALISAILTAMGGVLEAIGVMAASPAIVVAHMGAQAGFFLDRNLLDVGITRNFGVISFDVLAVAGRIQ